MDVSQQIAVRLGTTCRNGHIQTADTVHFTSSGKYQCQACRRAQNRRYKNPRRTKEYSIWASMKGRCQNPKDKNYHHYGARGIKVCERWQKFENFIADMGPRPEGMSLDRYPDNNGNYEPGNCRWATWAQQHRNTRRTHFITHLGRTLCLSDWAALAGESSAGLSSKIRHHGEAKAMSRLKLQVSQ